MSIRSCLYNEVFSDVSCGVENGLKIEVVRAHWGGSNDRICPNKKVNKSCQSKDVTEKIAER